MSALLDAQHTNDKQSLRFKILTWLLAAFSLVILAIQCAVPVASDDLWWHMAIGRHILTTGQLIVDHSIFTWGDATPYHAYNAWITEIILYLIYNNTGDLGLIALRYSIYCGFFALAIYFAIKRQVIWNPFTWVIITIGIVLSFNQVLIRPEIFSFVLMFITVWLYFSIRTIGIRAWKMCYLFPVILIVWVNSHGAFVLSSLFFLSIAFGEGLNTLFKSPLAMPTRLQRHLFISFALCIPALLVNSYGYDLPLYILNSTVINTSETSELSILIYGFDPTYNYNSPPYYAIDYLILSMMIYIFLVWQQLKQKVVDWVIIISYIFYALLFVKFVRSTYLLAPVFVFSGLDMLAFKYNSWFWSNNKKIKIAIAFVCVSLIGLIGWRAIYGATCHSNFGNLLISSNIDRAVPIEEVDYISKIPSTVSIKKIGNVYQYGGYLMYRLWPNSLAMIDTRYFPFKHWFRQYLEFERGNNIKAFLDQHQVDIWLINNREIALIAWFVNSGIWDPLFIGPSGIVFGRASSAKHDTIISPNIEHTDSFIALQKSFAITPILQNWSLAERLRVQTASIAEGRPWCDAYRNLASDMQNIITGSRAFIAGDYETAATNLSEKMYFFDFSPTAITAKTTLAQRAWKANNYAQARTLAIDALRLSPKNVISVYNAAIADWQYKKVPTVIPVTDDITWQFLVDILLSHQEKIPPAMRKYIVSVFTAMQNGTLHAKPTFIAQ